MSPMAKMPGSAVCWASSTLTKPRSSSILVFSMPTFSRARRAADGDENLFGFLHLRLAVGVGPGDLDAGFGLLDFFNFGSRC